MPPSRFASWWTLGSEQKQKLVRRSRCNNKEIIQAISSRLPPPRPKLSAAGGGGPVDPLPPQLAALHTGKQDEKE